MKKVILVLFVIMGLGVNAQTDVYFNMEHFLGTAPFDFNTTATNNINQEFQVTRLQYYIAEIKLIHDGGTETIVSNLWILVDASITVNELLGSFNITNLEAVEFGIGIENAYNHLDPATYSIQHPLGPKSPSMHWGWSSGYRFLAIEGKSGANFNLTYEIHALGDANYDYVSLVTAGSVTGSEININIEADYEMVLRGVNVSSGPISHSETGISATALENFNGFVFSLAANSPNGVDDVSVSSIVNLYPNPSTGIVNVNINNQVSGEIEIIVMDVRSSVITRKVISGTNSDISIKNNGLYLVSVLVDGQIAARKKVIISQ